MIEQLKTFDDNRLAVEVIDGFTETDEKSVKNGLMRRSHKAMRKSTAW